jgi:predicted RNase H-like HicB family nuclease
MRQIILHLDEDGYWVAECPSLPGCLSQGKSKAEAVENIREAIEGFLEVLREDGREVPEDEFKYELIAV